MKFFILFLTLIYTLSANIILTDETTKVNNFTISYLYDEGRMLNIEQVVQREFDKTTRSQFSFGYVNGTTWYKIIITNPYFYTRLK